MPDDNPQEALFPIGKAVASSAVIHYLIRLFIDRLARLEYSRDQRDVLQRPLFTSRDPLKHDVINHDFAVKVHLPSTLIKHRVLDRHPPTTYGVGIPLLRAVHTPGRLRQKVALVLQKVLDAPEPTVEGLLFLNPVDDVSRHFR
jgi:hypothetical protein